MDLTSNIVINIYSITILIVIGIQSLRQDQKNTPQFKLFMLMLQVTILLLIVDILSRFDGNVGTFYPVINHIGNFLIFLLNPILPSLWLLYVFYEIFQNIDNLKLLFYPIVAIYITHAFMVILSQFYGWFYYIDQNNIYYRGPLFWFTPIITIVMVLISLYLIINNNKKIEKTHFLSLVLFVAIQSTGIILQLMFYGISIMLNCVVLSLLIVFLNIQNHSIYNDFLTGVNNRKKLEIYLKDKINSCNENKTFSAIMIDLNNFKSINDNFGHGVGDHALQISAKILNSCLRTNDFIGRYGGDEFVIIFDISNIENLEEVVSRINYSAEVYNESSIDPFKISFSMGYAVYNYHAQLTIDEFLKQIDILMYENKHASKKLNNTY